MINELKKVELEYVRCFSTEKHFENYIEFADNKFPDTFTGNVTVFNDNVKHSEILDVINKDIVLYKKGMKDFLNFEVNDKVKKNIINDFIIKPYRMDKFIYMMIENKKFVNMNKKDNVVLKNVNCEEDLNNFIKMNVKDNIPFVGKSYSEKRMKRKVQVYKDLSNKLNPYICYKNNVPIGSLEVLIYNNICKVEDFLILKKYRNQGFGTHVIREILKKNYEKGIDYTYIIAESKGRAVNFYKKLGFTNMGEKTQIIWG